MALDFVLSKLIWEEWQILSLVCFEFFEVCFPPTLFKYFPSMLLLARPNLSWFIKSQPIIDIFQTPKNISSDLIEEENLP